jgi:hypothetical protein
MAANRKKQNSKTRRKKKSSASLTHESRTATKDPPYGPTRDPYHFHKFILGIVLTWLFFILKSDLRSAVPIVWRWIALAAATMACVLLAFPYIFATFKAWRQARNAGGEISLRRRLEAVYLVAVAATLSISFISGIAYLSIIGKQPSFLDDVTPPTIIIGPPQD